MIKLGKVKELQSVVGLPIEVEDAVKELLEILDNEYGEERDVDKDLGGFVAVIESEQDFQILKQEHYLDVKEQEPEWIINTVTNKKEIWKQALFVMSSDYSIVVVGVEDILSFLGEE